jgi:hypothetical protein
MEYIEAFNIIEAFREELECSVEHDIYTVLNTERSKELLEALDTVDY